MNNCNDECFSCRDVREIADFNDTGAINENFQTLRDEVQALCDKLNMYITAAGLDADGKCITNVKDCCDDPSSAVPRSGIEELIRELCSPAATTCTGCTSTSCTICSNGALPNAH